MRILSGARDARGDESPRIANVSRRCSLCSRLSSATGRVLNLKEWEEKMAKQSNDDSQDNNRREPATSKEKTARLKEMEKLGTRGMLLGIMEKLGDEHVSDDQLRRALIILEGLEPDEKLGVKPILSL